MNTTGVSSMLRPTPPSNVRLLRLLGPGRTGGEDDDSGEDQQARLCRKQELHLQQLSDSRRVTHNGVNGGVDVRGCGDDDEVEGGGGGGGDERQAPGFRQQRQVVVHRVPEPEGQVSHDEQPHDECHEDDEALCGGVGGSDAERALRALSPFSFVFSFY